MRQRKTNRGFTLLELMIVVSIVGMLASVAVPTYLRYISQIQVARVYTEISAYRSGVETFLQNGQVAILAADAESAVDYQASNLSTVAFGTFADAANSTITATLDGDTNVGIHDTTIALQRSAAGEWTCTVTGSGGDWSDKFKPGNCN